MQWHTQPLPDPIAIRGEQRVFTAQLVFCVTTGAISFILFCVVRQKWPRLYAARLMRNSIDIKPLPDGFLRWIGYVIRISDEDILRISGLDAYVYLAFFRMGLSIFVALALMGLLILSPVRYYFTGSYDKESLLSVLFQTWISPHSALSFSDPVDSFPAYYWVYPIFTYLFSAIVYIGLHDFTTKVLRTRQKYLASQNSIVDRTFRLDGIPPRLMANNNPKVLKRFIENLGLGVVVDVKFLYDWKPLNELFDERKTVLVSLERLYASVYGMKVLIDNHSLVPNAHCLDPPFELSPRKQNEIHSIDTQLLKLQDIDAKIRKLQGMFDQNTTALKLRESAKFRQLPCAFVTMETVASAQMASQTVLDPRVHRLIASLAPAPRDICWHNFHLLYFQKQMKSYLITIVIFFSYLFIIFLVTPLTTLLDLKTLTKFWPALGHYIGSSRWATTFVTGILPPLLFSLLNLLMPYFYQYLSRHQGYCSNSDVELSTLSKNFFFVFFNLFLVFMVTGTIWDYISYISDTTKIAYQLARSLKKLSLFYVDLILLQGLAMFPIRLLQVGNFVILNVFGRIWGLRKMFLRTPRDYRAYYYTPEVFSFGLDLPQHLLIFMIILIYSVVSTKIVTSGLVYFGLGAFVYKYQLLYNVVHPPHSTGKVWPMIVRRIIFGLVIFQLFMCGTLALESAVFLAVLCVPLVPFTFVFLYNFEKYYITLNLYIALRAIINYDEFDTEFDEEDGVEVDTNAQTANTNSADSQELDGTCHVSRASSRRNSTIDENREMFSEYLNPLLTDPLYGPWVGFEGNIILMIRCSTENAFLDDLESGVGRSTCPGDRQIVIRKSIRASEWE